MTTFQMLELGQSSHRETHGQETDNISIVPERQSKMKGDALNSGDQTAENHQQSLRSMSASEKSNSVACPQ